MMRVGTTTTTTMSMAASRLSSIKAYKHLGILPRSTLLSSKKKNTNSSSKFSSFVNNDDNGNKLHLILPTKKQQESLKNSKQQKTLILSPLLNTTTASSSSSSSLILTTRTEDDYLKAIDAHYDKHDQFVGGMGENDEGVWFVSALDNNTNMTSNDPLLIGYADMILNIIKNAKERRHGVPFGLYSSGLIGDRDNTDLVTMQLLKDCGLSQIDVTLGTHCPDSYAEFILQDKQSSSTDSAKRFGSVCSFIARLSETGFPVQVSVLKEFQQSASELAYSLGAVSVNSY